MKATLLSTAALTAAIGTLALFSAESGECSRAVFRLLWNDLSVRRLPDIRQASVNDIGASTAPVLFIGADNVMPNGATTSGVATFPLDESIPPYPLLNMSSPAFPNQISTGIGKYAVPFPYDDTGKPKYPDLLKSWSLTFTNGSNTVYAPTPSSAGYSLPPFANSVTVTTGGPTTPTTVSWIGSGDGAFVQVLSKNGLTLYSQGDLPATGSAEISPSIINTSNSYVIVVAEAYTHDGKMDTPHYNEAAISRALFDYTVNLSAPHVPINVPMIDGEGVYRFKAEVLGDDTTTYIDPPITNGFIYQTGAGDPHFASVMLPVLPEQTSAYKIQWDNGLDTAFVSGGQRFDFGGTGVSEFESRESTKPTA